MALLSADASERPLTKFDDPLEHHTRDHIKTQVADQSDPHSRRHSKTAPASLASRFAAASRSGFGFVFPVPGRLKSSR